MSLSTSSNQKQPETGNRKPEEPSPSVSPPGGEADGRGLMTSLPSGEAKWGSSLRVAGCWLLVAAFMGCAAHDPRPVAEDVVCFCKGDLGCVCVRVDGDTPRSEYGGQTYYFCADGCKTAFDKDPGKWVQEYRRRKGG